MFRKRYLSIAISLFVIGVIFGIFMNEYNSSSFRAVIIAIASLSVIVFLLFERKSDIFRNKIIVATAFAVASFSLGTVCLSFYNDEFDRMKVYDGRDDVVTFKVVEVNSNSFDSEVVHSKLGLAEGKLVRVYLRNQTEELIVGDYFEAEIKYDYQESNQFRASEISLSATGEFKSYKNGDGVFYNIRKYASETIDILFDDFEYASKIAKGVILGDRSELTSYVFNVYKISGISHVLAISGLHISILTASLYQVLLFLKLGRKISSLISVISAIFYTAMVGFIPGAVRSAFMISVAMILGMFLKNNDNFTNLFIALMILMVQNPYCICSVGMQLSFLCTLGIILFTPLLYKASTLFVHKLRRSKGIKHLMYKCSSSMLSSLVTSFAATLFSFPVICVCFDTVSVITPIMNIIAVPLFTYGIKLSIVALFVSLISDRIAMIFAYPAGFLFDFVTELSGVLFNRNVGFTSVHTFAIVIPLIICIISIVFVAIKPTRKIKKYVIFSIIFTISLSFVYIHNQNAREDLAVVEYSGARSEYIYVSYENKDIYIDVGGYVSNPDVVFENISTNVEGYIFSEYNSYSFERLDYFTSSVSVDKIFLPKPKNSSEVELVSKIKELANERKCDILIYNNSYTEYLSEEFYIEIFSGKDAFNKTLICVNVFGEKIRFLSDDFSDAVMCDFAILMNGYDFDKIENVHSQHIYASSKTSKNYEKNNGIYIFEETLKFKFDIAEREYKVYES